MQYDIGKGIWKAVKGAGIAALALIVVQLGDPGAFSDVGVPEGIAVAIAGVVRFAANFLKVKGVIG